MKRLRVLLLIIVTLVFAAVSLPQDHIDLDAIETDENPKTAIKFDEFGRTGDCELGARVDNLFIHLNNNPGTMGYVITYMETAMLPAQREVSPTLARIRMAINFRRYDASRLVMLDGGYRAEQGTEFFLVPPGSEPPEPTKTIPEPEMPVGTYLWGQSSIWGSELVPDLLSDLILPAVREREAEESRLAELESSLEAPETDGVTDDNPARESVAAEASGGPVEAPTGEPVDNVDQDAEVEAPGLTPDEVENERFNWVNERFGTALVARKGARGVIIFYADDQYYDVIKLRQFIERGRDRIATAAAIKSGQIDVVYGGYRSEIEAEYHIVPKRGKAPRPTPNERETQEQAETF